MAIATSLYCATQLQTTIPGACVIRETLHCHKPTLKSSLLPPVAVAAASSSVQAEPRTTAATPAKVLTFRVGHGFDLHRLEPGYPFVIGGVNISHDRVCEAHSDGALGLPDIGQIFPDTDPNCERQHLLFSLRRLPKVSPHKEAVRANLRRLLCSDPSVINLKAKTHEKVDSLGENRSIAAHTVVLLMRKY